MSKNADMNVVCDNIVKSAPVIVAENKVGITTPAKAIPVQWIKKWMNGKTGYYHTVAKKIIEDWENDNESQD